MRSRPQRRSIRLKGWDYRSAGCYFVTICTFRQEHIFADPRLYEVAANAWTYIPQQPHARHVALDEWVLMPNHLHGLIFITQEPEKLLAVPTMPSRGPLPGSLGAIVGNFKSLVAGRIKALHKARGSDMRVWHRGYWERIVRDERELNLIRRYIRENPARWEARQDNVDELLGRMEYIR